MAKFEPGRKCLIIRTSPSLHHYLFEEIVLIEKREGKFRNVETGELFPGEAWSTKPELQYEGKALFWLEKNLMPIDDPDVTDQIKAERDQSMVKAREIFSANLARVDLEFLRGV